MQTVTVAPSNSIIFISDIDGGDTPLADKPDPIMSTRSCISVGTLMFQDGDTAITLGRLSELRKDRPPTFDGVIDTPTGQVVVAVVDTTVLLRNHSGSPRTRVVIWTNHPSEPDEIVIGFERA